MRGHIQLHGLDRVQGRVGKKLCSTSPPCLGPTSPNRASRANRRSPDARPAGGRSEASDGSRRVPEVPRTTRSVPTGRPSSPIGRYTSEAVPQAAQHRTASRGTAVLGSVVTERNGQSQHGTGTKNATYDTGKMVDWTGVEPTNAN